MIWTAAERTPVSALVLLAPEPPAALRADARPFEQKTLYKSHVFRDESQTLGAPYSALTFTRMYTVPTLYGNRMYIGMNDGLPRSANENRSRERRRMRDSTEGLRPYRAIHPLAEDRDLYYRFTGGDTAAIIRIMCGRSPDDGTGMAPSASCASLIRKGSRPWSRMRHI